MCIEVMWVYCALISVVVGVSPCILYGGWEGIRQTF